MPVVQKVHVDKMLTNISVGYKNEDFIADEIFKVVSVQKQSDRYYVYGKEMFRVTDDRRAPGTSANEVDWSLSDDTYFCEGHAQRHFVPDEAIQNADEEFDLEAEATEFVTNKILLNKENFAAQKLLDSDNYDSDLVVATGGSGQPAKWSDYENSDPLALIEEMRVAVHQKSGLPVNTLILSQPVYSKLRIHPKLVSVFKNTDISIVPLNVMAELFEVDRILIGKALKSTAITQDGNDPLGYIWGKSAILAYVPTRPARKTPALGYQFQWVRGGQGAVQVSKWYDQDRKATIIEAEQYYDLKVVSNVAGVLFPDVVA